MADREKVIKDLEECLSASCRGFRPRLSCPYNDEEWDIMRDALELLKEQQGTGCWKWIAEDKYRCSECQNTTYVDECMEEPQYLFCPYCGHKMTFAGRN